MIFKKVEVWTLAKTYAAILTIFGLAIAILMGISILSRPGIPGGALLVLMLLVVSPIFYGAVGLLGGLISGILLNLGLKISGGINMDIEASPEHAGNSGMVTEIRG